MRGKRPWVGVKICAEDGSGVGVWHGVGIGVAGAGTRLTVFLRWRDGEPNVELLVLAVTEVEAMTAPKSSFPG